MRNLHPLVVDVLDHRGGPILLAGASVRKGRSYGRATTNLTMALTTKTKATRRCVRRARRITHRKFTPEEKGRFGLEGFSG